MATYTNLGIKQITTGDESGTWGDSTNTNFDYFDTAIVGYVSVTLASAGSSGSPNTLNVADFAASNGRNRIVEFVDAGDLGGTTYVQITPNDFEGYYFIRNGLSGSRSILLFQGTYDAARDYEIPNGKDIVVRCSGGGSTSYIYNVLENLQVGNLSVSSLTASTALALDANKNVASVTNTGTGNNVLATSPTLVTPVLGTPTSGTLTNCTGLPVSSGISGLGTGVATFLATPSSANLAAAVTDETGSGALVFATSPTLVTPVLGTPTSGTLTNCTGLPVSSGISGLGTGIATFLATPSSANLAAAVTNETGSGALVFATSPTITTPAITGGTLDNTQIGNTSATSARFNFNSSSPTAVRVDGADTGPTGASYRITFEDTVTLSSAVSGIGSTHVSYNANPSTSASTALEAYYAYLTYGIAKGTSATVDNQYGFIVGNSLTDATTNYAFYTNLGASGTSRYGFYAAGSAPNYFGGSTVISVTDNTNAALRVTQLGTGNALLVEDSTNPDATPFVVDASGNLVKGYTSAVSTVGISSAVYTPGIQGHTAGSTQGSFGLFTWSTNTTFANIINFSRSSNATAGSYTAVASGTNLGDILWCGADGNSTSSEFAPAARITARCDGTVADGSVPGKILFATTAAAGTNPTTRVSIDSNGYVGIGNTFVDPQKLLDLAGSNQGAASDTPVNTLRFTDTDTTSAANQPIGKIEFYNSDATNAAVGAYILSSSAGVDGGGTIRFGAAANAATVAEICRVADTGFTMTKDTAGLGYGTGTGGAVTQATSRTTGVTLNKTNGAITLVSAAGTATWQSFTVTNSTVAATDVVIVNQKSGTDLYMMHVTNVAAGSFRISFATTGGTTTEQPVFNFAVIKAVAA